MDSDNDKMADDLDRGFLYYLAAVIVLLLVFALGWCSRRALPEAPAPETRQVFISVAAEREYKRLLAKHGLNHNVSIIYEDHLGKYFIRDGERCAFR